MSTQPYPHPRETLASFAPRFSAWVRADAFRRILEANALLADVVTG